MRFAIHFLGSEVLAFELGWLNSATNYRQPITGGSSHNFERAEEAEPEYYEDFGFTKEGRHVE